MPVTEHPVLYTVHRLGHPGYEPYSILDHIWNMTLMRTQGNLVIYTPVYMINTCISASYYCTSRSNFEI